MTNYYLIYIVTGLLPAPAVEKMTFCGPVRESIRDHEIHLVETGNPPA